MEPRRTLDESDRLALVEELASAWLAEPEQGAGPTICEATDRLGRTIHVRVIWEAWAGLHASERCEIIVEALRQVRGGEAESRLQAVMGLTPGELGRSAR